MTSLITTILQLALSLLLAVQGNPSAPLAQQQQAIGVATQAVQLATQALQASSSPQNIATLSAATVSSTTSPVAWQEGNIELAISKATSKYFRAALYTCADGHWPCAPPPGVLMYFQIDAKNDSPYATSSTQLNLTEINASGTPIGSPSGIPSGGLVLGPNATTSLTASFYDPNGGTQFEFTTGAPSNVLFDATVSGGGYVITLTKPNP